MITTQVKKSFGKSVKSYAEHGSLQLEVSKKLFELFPLDGLHHSSILDIGSGTGFTSVQALNSSPSSSITAIDIAFPMSQETRQNGFALSLTADATALPFHDESFNAVVSSLAFQWIETNDLEKLYRSVYSVLEGGGTFEFSTTAIGTLSELRTAYDKACLHCTGKRAEFMETAEVDFIKEKLATVGFGNIDIKKITHRKEYGNVSLLFKALKGVGATLPGRPKNRPRRDVLEKAVEIYEQDGLPIKATYEISYIKCSRFKNGGVSV